MNINTRQRIFLCREVMSVRFEGRFAKDSAGDGLLPIADICREFGRAERDIDTRQHWKKTTAFQLYIFISVLGHCTRQLLLMYYMHAQHTFAPSLNPERCATLRACLCGLVP